MTVHARRPLRVYVIRVLILAIAVGILLFLSLIAYSVHISLEAESTYHAHRVVVEYVTAYVESQNKWPPDWNDLLDEIRKQHGGPPDYQPEMDRLRARVEIDFDRSISELAVLSEDDLDVVRANGPTFTLHNEKHWLYQAIQKAARFNKSKAK